MADIPRVPQVTPPALVNPQVHRIDRSQDRNPRQQREEEKTPEDILELHEESATETSGEMAPQTLADDSDHFDIAI